MALSSPTTMHTSFRLAALPSNVLCRSYHAVSRSSGVASTSYCRVSIGSREIGSSLVARATPSNEQEKTERPSVPSTPPSKDSNNNNKNNDDDEEEPIKPGSLALLRWSLYNEAWDVPWSGKETAGTMLAWAVSFVAVGAALAPLAASALGARNLAALSAQDKSLFLLLNQVLETVVGLSIVRAATRGKYRASRIPRDVLRVDFRRPLSFDASAAVDRSRRRRRTNEEESEGGGDDFEISDDDDGGRGGGGWLAWGLVGMAASPLVIGAAASAAAALSGLSGGATSSGRGTADAVAGLLGSSGSGTGIDGTTLASLLVVTAVLAPILEETVFRGFLLPSLTKVMPVPAAVVVSAAAFATAHLSARDFPQLLAFGVLLGFVHVRSRNLLSTMLMHGAWNGGVLLLLAALASSGVDLEKLLAS